jgi:hypothetical protein
MKHCPKCQSTYTDDTLGFCLQDGTFLLQAKDLSASADTLEMRIAPTESMETGGSTAEPKPFDSRSVPIVEPRSTRALLGGVFLIAGLLLVLVVLLAAFLLRGVLWDTERTRRGRGANVSNTSNTTEGTDSAPKISVSASSTRERMKGNDYDAANLLDENLGSAWIEGADSTGVGSWVQFKFSREVTLNSIKIYPGYFKDSNTWKKNNRVAQLTIFFSDGSSVRADFPDQMEPQEVAAGGRRTSSVKLVIDGVYGGTTDVNDTAISEVKFDLKP